MNENERAAFIMAAAARANCRALGMMSENLQRIHRGESIAYNESHFDGVIDSEGISHNSVMTLIRQ